MTNPFQTNQLAGIALLTAIIVAAVVSPVAAIGALAFISVATIGVLYLDQHIDAELPGQYQPLMALLASGCFLLVVGALAVDVRVAQLGVVAIVGIGVARWAFDAAAHASAALKA